LLTKKNIYYWPSVVLSVPIVDQYKIISSLKNQTMPKDESTLSRKKKPEGKLDFFQLKNFIYEVF
jgi:hypothetical protein